MAVNVPLRDPDALGVWVFGAGLGSLPRSTVRIVATAAVIRMTDGLFGRARALSMAAFTL